MLTSFSLNCISWITKQTGTKTKIWKNPSELNNIFWCRLFSFQLFIILLRKFVMCQSKVELIQISVFVFIKKDCICQPDTINTVLCWWKYIFLVNLDNYDYNQSQFVQNHSVHQLAKPWTNFEFFHAHSDFRIVVIWNLTRKHN